MPFGLLKKIEVLNQFVVTHYLFEAYAGEKAWKLKALPLI